MKQGGRLCCSTSVFLLQCSVYSGYPNQWVLCYWAWSIIQPSHFGGWLVSSLSQMMQGINIEMLPAHSAAHSYKIQRNFHIPRSAAQTTQIQ